MKERPILFNAEMVRAILSGRKTQTRRVIKPVPDVIQKLEARTAESGCVFAVHANLNNPPEGRFRWDNPLGKPGDRLWVREAFRMAKSLDIHSPSEVAELSLNAGYKNPWAPIQLEADGVRTGRWTGFDTPPVVTEPGKLRPSLHMPRWASRIDLLITGVRVERLSDINEHDAMAEGIIPVKAWTGLDGTIGSPGMPATLKFEGLWLDIYGEESWESNPWVWVTDFEMIPGATA